MTYLRNRALRHVVSAGALALGLALAACGVKGGLEPPPSAQASAEQTGVAGKPGMNQDPGSIGAPAAPPSATSLLNQPPAAAGIARGTTSAAVTHAPSAQRSSPLDWLIR